MLYSVIEEGDQDIVKLLLSNEKIDVNLKIILINDIYIILNSIYMNEISSNSFNKIHNK